MHQLRINLIFWLLLPTWQVNYNVPTDRIDIEHKLGQDQQPRFLEDEGIYIGVIPAMKNKNQNKMEHR
jgi:hypothetical protein